jgi:four helix bundle protein
MVKENNYGFRGLKVWQHAKGLAVYIYQLTNQGSFKRDFGLKEQIRRAAVSIPSNIAEGDERNTNKESVRFFYIAKGSLAEVVTQTIIARDIGYLSDKTYNEIIDKCSIIGKMLGKLIKVRITANK